MSHNLYTLNTTGANVFSYHGANLGFIKIGSGESVTFPSLPIAFGDTLQWYDPNKINTISGATFTESGGWVSEIHLPAGDYEFRVSVSMQISNSTGTIITHSMRFDQGSGYSELVGCHYIQRTPAQYSGTRVEPFKYSKIFSFSVATSIKQNMYFDNSTITATDPNNRASETQFLFIRRLA